MKRADNYEVFSYCHIWDLLATLTFLHATASVLLCVWGVRQYRSGKLQKPISPEKLESLGGERAVTRRLGLGAVFYGIFFLAAGIYLTIHLFRQRAP